MGARGPAPKSTNMRILEGNPSRRPLNDDEPKPEGKVTRPRYLTAAAKREWDRLAPVLEGCGILTAADVTLFAAFCDAVAHHQAVSKELDAEIGKRTDAGEPAYSDRAIKALITSQRNYAELMAKLGTKFGVSPSDRAGLKVSKPKEKSKWADKIR